ncbi:MAG: MBL fold metallo-hydrolase, partial [Bacillota bacterium]|nr:MBL fold metallo-hydrolase [Bacillota bacterium]
MAGKIEFVDELRITVLADNYVWSNSLCQGQWGASYLLDVKIKGQGRRILLDAGEYAEPVLFNMKLLGIDPGTIDLVVLSHSHHDHTGGLLGVLKAMGKEYVPVIAHPAIFQTSYRATPFYANLAVPLITARREATCAHWVLCESPMPVGAGIAFSGSIPRVTEFEPSGLPGLYVLDDGTAHPYDITDDAALYFNTPAGVVVVTGCAHAGIVNVVRHGAAATGLSQVAAVIGGFHLVGASEDRVARTIEALRAYPGVKIVTGHCTGNKAAARLDEAFGDDFCALSCGLVFDAM